jgi:hypothetical protein
MEAKFTLPPDIAQGATARGNEYGWTLDAFPQAIVKAQGLGYACLGGQFQFRLNDGTYEMYWLNADSNDRREDEPWAEYVRRSCGEVLGRFNAVVASTDFPKEASSWPSLATAMAHGLSIADHLVFVAYFVTEAEIGCV